jgi:hypothetical protein
MGFWVRNVKGRKDGTHKFRKKPVNYSSLTGEIMGVQLNITR